LFANNPLKSRFSSEQIDCLGFVDSVILMQLLFKEILGPFIENSIIGLLNGAPTFGDFFLVLVIFYGIKLYTSIFIILRVDKSLSCVGFN